MPVYRFELQRNGTVTRYFTETVTIDVEARDEAHARRAIGMVIEDADLGEFSWDETGSDDHDYDTDTPEIVEGPTAVDVAADISAYDYEDPPDEEADEEGDAGTTVAAADYDNEDV